MNKQAIIEALEAEGGLILGVFQDSTRRTCGHVGRCAIGALLHAAGAKDLRGQYSPSEGQRSTLLNTYGLDYYATEALMSFNDDYVGHGPARCRAVIEFVRNDLQ